MLLEYSRDLDAALTVFCGSAGLNVIKVVVFLAVLTVLLRIIVSQVREILGKSR